MANEKNLKKFTSDQSREKAAMNGRAGGIASGKAKRAKRTFRDLMQALLDEPVKNRKVISSYAAELGIGDKVSVKELMTIMALVNKLKDVTIDDLSRLALLVGETVDSSGEASDGKLEIVFVDNSKKDGDADE
ncbi:MAG: hypothetical protein IJY01_00475 [Clostridia bacterium]|nr:hypothetical protein [Clostridia bacterium]